MDNKNNTDKDPADGAPLPYPNNAANSQAYSAHQPPRVPAELNGNSSGAQPETGAPPGAAQLSHAGAYGYTLPSHNGVHALPQMNQGSNPSGPIYMNFHGNNVPAAHYGGPEEIPVPAAPEGENASVPLFSENGVFANSALLHVLNGSLGNPSGVTAPSDGTLAAITQDQMLAQGPLLLNKLNSVAEYLAAKGEFTSAIKYYERITGLDPENGAAWTALGHCYLLTEELHRAFESYQKALYSLTDVRDPQLWYGIGLLYDKVRNLQ